MDSLSAVLPTFKSARSAFAAGGIWLLALVIIVQPRAHEAGRGLREIWGAVSAVGGLASVVPVVGVLAAAYVLGTVSDALFGAISRTFAICVVKTQRWVSKVVGVTPGGWWDGPRWGSTFEDFRNTALGGMWAEVEDVQPGTWKRRQGQPKERRREVRDKTKNYIGDVWTKLQSDSSAAAFAAELDELCSDASYRLQLMAPLGALVVALALYAPVVWTAVIVVVVLTIVVGLAGSANNRVEKANDDLQKWFSKREGPSDPGSESSAVPRTYTAGR